MDQTEDKILGGLKEKYDFIGRKWIQRTHDEANQWANQQAKQAFLGALAEGRKMRKARDAYANTHRHCFKEAINNRFHSIHWAFDASGRAGGG
jgi:hypothetical protein